MPKKKSPVKVRDREERSGTRYQSWRGDDIEGTGREMS